jgi:glycosyltransferase involved in cell wall biosynthesis
MNPKVSVIMPVHNGAKFIVPAIESVLAQSYTNYELVVIDDGSTDDSYLKIEGYRDKLKYIPHTTQKGVCTAMNTGIRNASGELIAFLDSDDLWLPEMLHTQVDYLMDHQDVAMVHSDFQTIDDEDRIIEDSVAYCQNLRIPSGYIFKELFMDSLICGITVVVRKECFERVGYLDETLYFGDYDLWLRISKHYLIGYMS